MEFVALIELDNDAFADGNMEHELSRILQTLAKKIEGGNKDGNIRDGNGNSVGNFAIRQ